MPAQVRLGVVAILTALALLTDVWRFGHLLLVHHVACPYDGVLIHADEVHEVAEAPSRVSKDPRVLPASVIPRHEHENCCARSAVHRPFTFAFDRQTIVGAAELGLLLPPSVAQSSSTYSVLAYAPKLSPPV